MNKKHIIKTSAFLLTILSLASCGKKTSSVSNDTISSTSSAEQITTISNDKTTTKTSTSEGKQKYQVTFKNYDELDLYVAEVEEGGTAVYVGDEPTKPSTFQYDYTFAGWDKELTHVKSSFTTYAVYDQSLRKYSVIFKNYDGEVLQNTKEEYGSMPSYNGAEPVRVSDAVAEYKFAGWDKEITHVTEDVVYTAVYDATYAPAYRSSGIVFQIQGYNEYYAVIRYFGDSNNVAIPQVFDGKPVKKIKAGAFSGHDKLESIFIPKTITEIEPHAFDNCGAITHLTVGEGNTVYFIDENGDLASNDTLVFTLPSHNSSFEVKDQYTRVLEGAFSCSKIRTLNISAASFTTLPELFSVDAAHMPEALKSLIIKGGDIGDDQFNGCKHLVSISLLNTAQYLPVSKVGDRAFKDCENLNSLVFDNELVSIGDEAFNGCLNLVRLQIGTDENLKLSSVGKYVFDNTPKLNFYSSSGISYLGNPACPYIVAVKVTNKNMTYAYIPEETRFFADRLFKDCVKLEDFYLNGKKLLSIGDEVFANCIALQNLNLHMLDDENYLENIHYLPYNTFIGCTKLLKSKTITDKSSSKVIYINSIENNSVTIGKDVLGISSTAFSTRTNGTVTIDFNNENKSFTFKDNILRDYEGNICVASFESETSTNVFCGGRIVFNNAFYNQSIGTVIFDDDLKIISSYAFYKATISYDEIELPRNLEVLEGNAFYETTMADDSIRTINFYSYDKLESIGKNAFFAQRSVNFYTPFEDRQEGWVDGFNSLYYEFNKFNIFYSYGI